MLLRCFLYYVIMLALVTLFFSEDIRRSLKEDSSVRNILLVIWTTLVLPIVVPMFAIGVLLVVWGAFILQGPKTAKSVYKSFLDYCL